MLRNNTEEIVIRPRLSSPAKAALTLSALVLLAVSTGAAYWLGGRATDDLETVVQLKQALGAERRRNRRLQESLAQAERQLGIDKTAYGELSAALTASTTQMAELESELKFYRGIIAPADNQSGVKIQDFSIKRMDEAERYRYKLVLIQALKHNQIVRGNVNIAIKGVQDGDEKVLNTPAHDEKPLAVKFKYFQNLEGVISLPPGFQPSVVTITLVTGEKKPKTTERSYPWPAA